MPNSPPLPVIPACSLFEGGGAIEGNATPAGVLSERVLHSVYHLAAMNPPSSQAGPMMSLDLWLILMKRSTLAVGLSPGRGLSDPSFHLSFVPASSQLHFLSLTISASLSLCVFVYLSLSLCVSVSLSLSRLR